MNNTKYTLEELLYMLAGDTTVMAGLLLENSTIKARLFDCITGDITYDELVKAVYEEF